MNIKIIFTFILLSTNVLLNASVISSYEERDLELFSSLNNTHGGLVSTIDHTQTGLGKKQLHHILKATITTDEKVLTKRQNFIRYLLEHQEVKQQLEEQLTTIRQHEKALKLFLAMRSSKLHEQTFSSLYFDQKVFKKLFPSLIKSLNESPAALTLRHYFPADLLAPLLEVVIFHVFANQLEAWFKPKHDKHHHHEHHDHDHHHNHGHGHGSCGCSKIKADKGAPLGVKIAARGLQLLHLLLHASAFNEGIHNTLKRHDLVALMHAQIREVAKCIVAMNTIVKIMKNIQQEVEVPFALPEKTDVTSIAMSDDIGIFAHVGEVLTAHKKLIRTMDQINKLSTLAGNVDAYVGITELFEEHSKTKQHYCFATFVSPHPQARPVIRTQKMWNPMLNANSVTPNDIALGCKGDKKLIITGPNKAGKSSIIKAVALNAILAQTFGIAAAESFTLTPLNRIITYINVSDDISQEQSSFVAEVMRADACLKELTELDDLYTLTIIDDSLFKSTNYEQGQKLAFDFIKALGKHHHAMILVATHFPMLTQLPENTNDAFSNYHIEIVENSEGDKESSYQLKPGIDQTGDAFALVAQQHAMTFG